METFSMMYLFQKAKDFIYTKKFIWLFGIGLLEAINPAYAQHLVPASGASTISVCSGTVTDNGGTGNYSNNANGSLTIKPGTAGNYVKLSFTAIDTYDYSDILYVYDGISTSAKLIYSTYGNTNYSTTVTKDLYATNPDGALTVRLVSNGASVETGFSANISCTSTMQPADVKLESGNLRNAFANAGGSMVISYQVRNIGGAPATAHGIGVYLSKDDQYESSDVFLGSIGVAELLQDAAVNVYGNPYGDLIIPASTVKGKYYVIIIDNYNNTFVDANPANNIKALPIAISDYKMSGTITTCSDTISDIGGNGNYYDNQNYSLVINPAIAGNMVKLDFTTFSTQASYDYMQIYNGNSVTAATLLGTYSGTVSPGTVYATNSTGALTIRFVSNFDAVTAGYKAGVSCIPVTSLPPADLIVTALTSTVTKATNLEKITLTATCKNQGIKTSAITNAGFYISKDMTLSTDDVLLGTTSIVALVQGTSKVSANLEVTIPADQQMGSFYILAAADKDNTELEGSETNNVKELAFTIDNNYKMPTGNAIVTRMVCSGTLSDNGGMDANYVAGTGTVVLTPGTAGNFIKLKFTKYDQNYGTLSIYDGTSASAPLISNFNDSFPLEGRTVCATNSTGSLTIKFTSTSADIGFVADISCVSTAEYPDLEMSLLTVSPTTIEPGSALALTAKLKNIGSVTAISSNIQGGFYLSKDKTYDAADKEISASGWILVDVGTVLPLSNTQTLPANTLPGEYYILAVADNGKTVKEPNRDNNTIFLSITVITPPVDLTLLSPACNTTAIGSGGTIDLTGIVNNTGTKSARATSVGYYLSANNVFEPTDVLLGSSAVAAIGAGATKNVSATVKIPGPTSTGTYYIFFVADYSGLQTETNELNNAVALPVTLQVTDIKDEVETTQISIYPNPAQTTVALGDKAASSEVYNVQGALLIRSSGQSLDVSSLPQGLYILIVNYANNQKITYKLIKE